LGELMEIAYSYDISISWFQLISLSSPRWLMKTTDSIYEKEFNFISSFVIEISYT
jgi:hypothetical protein